MVGLGGMMHRKVVAASMAVAGGLMAGGLMAVGAGVAPAAAAGAQARAARTISLNETGSLHRTGHHGFHIDEEGTASGTIRGKIYIHLDITSTNQVTAEVNIYPSGGSLSGEGSAAYRTEGGQATFSGTLSISRGSGSYAGAHASGLSFSGTIQRANDNTVVHLSGNLTT